MSLSCSSRVFFSLRNLRTCSILKVKYSSDHGTSAVKDPVPEGACGTKKAPLKRAVTPIGKLDELEEGKHPFQEKEPLPSWPDGKNPNTGEVGGPKGPEPTRYGDWERKGRVTDF